MSDLMLDVDQAGEVKAAFRRGCWTNTEIKKACAGNFFGDVRQVLIGRARIVPIEITELATIDPIVRVDRTVRPVYPDWVATDYINTPELVALEKMGPSEFDASRLRKWLHPKQKKGVVTGHLIHTVLKEKQMLSSCIGLADLFGIKAKGAAFFRQNFKDQVVFGWRSVVPHRDGRLCVPGLILFGGEVVLRWDWLGVDWGETCPALRLAS